MRNTPCHLNLHRGGLGYRFVGPLVQRGLSTKRSDVDWGIVMLSFCRFNKSAVLPNNPSEFCYAKLTSFLLIPQFICLAADETADLSSPSEAAQAMRLSNGKTYYLRNKKSGMYLDLQSSGVVNSTHFQQYPGHCPSELFYFNNQGGYYVIETTLVGASGRMVMDGRKNCVAGAQVVLYESVSDAPEQRWHLRRNGNGTFSISPKKNVYLNLAVSGGSSASNAKVVLADRNNEDPNQQWCLEPAYFADYDWQYVLDDANTFSRISSGYLEYRAGEREPHYGIDIVSKTSTSIAGQYLYTPMDGVVVYKSSETSAGNYVVIETDCFYTGKGEKIRVGFMHMSHPYFFGTGTRVEKGDHIGFVGNTGNSTGYHLHLSVYKNKDDEDIRWANGNNRRNPQRFFPSVPFTGATSNAE